MLMDIIKARHSIRKYTDKQISREDMEKIMEAGNFAPNAGGGQRSILIGVHNKDLATEIGIMNLQKFDRSNLAGSYVSKEQPSVIDDEHIKNGFYDAPSVVAIFGQNGFLFREATVDSNGNPQIRCVSAIHYEGTAMYFFTARGKNFCRELLETGNVQVLAHTKFNEMIRLSGKAVPVPENEQRKWIDIIFSEQPYLSNVYPNRTREIGIVFCIKSAEIEYFNLGVNPIFREFYTTGNEKISFKGYKISDNCIGCGACEKVCPQRCIEKGRLYKIHQNNCLHCGACYEKCPVKAIERLG